MSGQVKLDVWCHFGEDVGSYARVNDTYETICQIGCKNLRQASWIGCQKCQIWCRKQCQKMSDKSRRVYQICQKPHKTVWFRQNNGVSHGLVRGTFLDRFLIRNSFCWRGFFSACKTSQKIVTMQPCDEILCLCIPRNHNSFCSVGKCKIKLGRNAKNWRRLMLEMDSSW